MGRFGYRTYDTDLVMDVIDLSGLNINDLPKEVVKKNLKQVFDSYGNNSSLSHFILKEEYLGIVVYAIDNDYTDFSRTHLERALDCCYDLLSDEDYEDSFGRNWSARERKLKEEKIQIIDILSKIN